MSRRRRRLILLAAILLEPIAMWLRGYPIGGRLVVRCRQGHLFRTLWIPGVSVKALRFGWWRFQRCPSARATDGREAERRLDSLTHSFG